jgi:uncharacterized membrane protein
MTPLAAASIALLAAYPLLAHWASHGGGPLAASLALADLALLVLIEPLAQRRAWAWITLTASFAALAAGLDTPWPSMALLAPPVLFTGWVAWVFARTLHPPREPLITRLAAALEYDGDSAAMPPAQQRYTRTLTGAWATMLAVLTLANAALALVAEPHGLLVRLGHTPPWTVSEQAWSWWANLLNYGAVAVFFAAEWLLRCRLLPDRRRQGPRVLWRRMRELGPPFWAGLVR